MTSSRTTTYRRSAMHRRSSFLHSDLVQILLFYILPFIVINLIIFFLATAKPKYELSVAPTDDYRTTTVTFTIQSRMPLKEVDVLYNSEPLDLVKLGKKNYQATLTENGILDVYMKNFNGMSVSSYELVDILDDTCPELTYYDVEDGKLSVVVNDTQSGIDFSSIHGVSSTGEIIEPESIDKTTGAVIFDLPEDGITLSISDLSGNEYQPSFSVVLVTEDEDAENQENQLIIE